MGRKPGGPGGRSQAGRGPHLPNLSVDSPRAEFGPSPPLSQHRICPGTWQGLGEGAGGACPVRQGLLRSAARVKSDKPVLSILSVRTQKTQWAPGLR